MTPFHKTLHGIARLQVHLARMEEAPISTRGWSYNDLVNWSIGIGGGEQAALRTLLDALDGVCEIGSNAVDYLKIWQSSPLKE